MSELMASHIVAQVCNELRSSGLHASNKRTMEAIDGFLVALGSRVAELETERDAALKRATDAEGERDKWRREAGCPCCRNGVNLDGGTCSECYGKGLAILAYEHGRFLHKRQREEIYRLREALKAIDSFEQESFDWTEDEWAKHTPETCAECKRWKEMKHPLQHSCDGWYRLLHKRKQINQDRYAATGNELKKIARAALAAPPVEGQAEEEIHGDGCPCAGCSTLPAPPPQPKPDAWTKHAQREVSEGTYDRVPPGQAAEGEPRK